MRVPNGIQFGNTIMTVINVNKKSRYLSFITRKIGCYSTVCSAIRTAVCSGCKKYRLILLNNSQLGSSMLIPRKTCLRNVLWKLADKNSFAHLTDTADEEFWKGLYSIFTYVYSL